jgi:predicted nucleotidyltransferase
MDRYSHKAPMEQRSFQAELTTFCSGGIFSAGDLWLSLLSPRLPLKRHARRICDEYATLAGDPEDGPDVRRIRVGGYNGKNQYVKEMRDFLRRWLSGDLVAALVHGSLATGEETSYSDFDALAILKDEVMRDPRRLAAAARRLGAAQGIMFRLDPLQHHGWFVISESQLLAYPEPYLPVSVLEAAKALFPGSEVELAIRPLDSAADSRRDFLLFGRRLLRKLETVRRPGNLFELKSTLSAFMLLPSLYVHARDGRGVFKKYSFSTAKPDFSPEEWAVMDEVSKIRADWQYHISPAKKWLLAKPHPVCRYFATNRGPRAPRRLKVFLNDEFYQRLAYLVEAMMAKVEPASR